jgi:uncharacterized protein YdeI (YjbR/CyaY-like superfamily)
MSQTPQPATSHKGEAVLQFRHQAEWAQWLDQHHAGKAIWLRHAKKGAPVATVTNPEALEVALCFGWIDGQRNAESEHFYLQRWCPRGPRSPWSQINRDKALGYIQSGHMQPAGMAEIEKARQDGRWDTAYAPASKAQVPPDLQAALHAHPGAAEFFATVSAQNRYAVLFRIQGAKKPETRARRIQQFAQMLARGETVYPQTTRKAKPAGS